MKFKILQETMLRNDLSAAELRIVWFILINAIGETGKARISNHNIRNALRLDHSTIIRAKRSLRRKKVLTWTADRKLGASTHLACEYSFFLQKEEVHPRTQLQGVRAPSLGARTHPASKGWKRNHGTQQNGNFYASADSAELAYWDAYLRKTTGRSPPRDRQGGWEFPSQWPQEQPQ